MCVAGMVFCMRTTVDLDDDLLRAAKVIAATEGRTLTSVIEDGLRSVLAPPDDCPEPVRFTTVGGNGPLPGVDLDDSGALLDLLEADDAAP